MEPKPKNTLKDTIAITALSACIMLGAVGVYRLTEGGAHNDTGTKNSETTDTQPDSLADVPLDLKTSDE